MSICIYCDRQAGSREHVLPAAFGEFENAPNLVNRICGDCNHSLGLLDEQYSRCGPEGFFRELYGIEGRSTHDKVNVFERGSAGGQRISFTSKDPNLGIDVALECENGIWRQMRQLIFVEQSGRTQNLPIREGTTPDHLRAAYQKLGVAQPSDMRIFYADDEREWVERLIMETWPSVTFGSGTKGSRIYRGAEGTLGLTNRYFREVAKIGFHYFLTQFPQYSGRELLFSDIRGFILNDAAGVDHANDFIGKRQEPLIGEMLTPGTRPDGWRAHVLCAETKPGGCLAHVQMFLSEDWPAPTYSVTLAKSPTIVDVQASGTFYMYFESGSAGGKFAGETHSLEVKRTDYVLKPSEPVVKSIR